MSDNLKITQVVPRIADLSSGPSLSVPSLCGAVARTGVDVQLMALEPRATKLMFENTKFFPTIGLPFCHRLGVSPTMFRALKVAAQETHVIHTHSLWMMPNIYPHKAALGTDCKVMVSPRGTVSSWARSRSRVRKWVMWQLGQRNLVEQADCIHATSHEELRESRELNKRSPVAVVPNGVACPDAVPESDTSKDSRSVLFLARIHPKKGVDVLLRAWKTIETEFPDWQLKIAGPLGHAFASEMIELTKTLGLKRTEFIGEVRGEAKVRAFADSSLYVLPTHSENFGISVAEALAHGVPAIVCEGAPWEGLTTNEAGWWIPYGEGSLTDAFRQALKLSDSKLAAMGQNGHGWMKQQFDWTVIGKRMAEVYKWVAFGGSPPDDIVID